MPLENEKLVSSVLQNIVEVKKEDDCEQKWKQKMLETAEKGPLINNVEVMKSY